MKFVKTSPFGALEEIREGRPHFGVDYAMEEGTPLGAVMNGIVKKVADYGDTNAGKTVMLELEDGNMAIYGHLSEFAVKEGDIVEQGQLIGLSGNSGFSTGPHLHFAIKENGEFINPSEYEPILMEVAGKGSWLDTLGNTLKGPFVHGKEAIEGKSSVMSNFGQWLADWIGGGLKEFGLLLCEWSPEIITGGVIVCASTMMVAPMLGQKTGLWFGRMVGVLWVGIMWRVMLP